jgi:3-oxoacyl-(acyl-carrier-protein) synthase
MGNGQVGGIQMQQNAAKIVLKGYKGADKLSLFKFIKNATASATCIELKHRGLFNCLEFDNNTGVMTIGEAFLSVFEDDSNVIISGSSDFLAFEFYEKASDIRRVFTH